MRDHDFCLGPHCQINIKDQHVHNLAFVDYHRGINFGVDMMYRDCNATSLLALASALRSDTWLFCFTADGEVNNASLSAAAVDHLQTGTMGVIYLSRECLVLAAPQFAISSIGARRITSKTVLPVDTGQAFLALEEFISRVDKFTGGANEFKRQELVVCLCSPISPK